MAPQKQRLWEKVLGARSLGRMVPARLRPSGAGSSLPSAVPASSSVSRTLWGVTAGRPASPQPRERWRVRPGASPLGRVCVWGGSPRVGGTWRLAHRPRPLGTALRRRELEQRPVCVDPQGPRHWEGGRGSSGGKDGEEGTSPRGSLRPRPQPKAGFPHTSLPTRAIPQLLGVICSDRPAACRREPVNCGPTSSRSPR